MRDPVTTADHLRARADRAVAAHAHVADDGAAARAQTLAPAIALRQLIQSQRRQAAAASLGGERVGVLHMIY